LFEQSSDIFRRLGEKAGLGVPMRLLGHLALRRGDYPVATNFILESLTLNTDVSDKRGVAACLAAFAELAAAQGRASDAVRLCGCVDALLEAMHTRLLVYDDDRYGRNLAAL